MNKRYGTTIATAVALTAALWSFSVAAETKTLNVSTDALSAGQAESPNGPAPGPSYSTGFEAGEGFAPGYCAQNGWTAFVVSTTEGHIDTVNPADGFQHARISLDPTLFPLTNTGCFSPDLGVQPLAPSMMSVDVAISGLGGADYDVVPQAPSQAMLMARVKFSFTGDILILESGGFVDSGADFPVGPYFNLRIETDPVANEMFYFIDDVLIHSSASGVFAATTMEQVVLLSDNFHIGDEGDFDNVVIVNDFTGEPTEQARFFVAKNFDDDNPAEVEVTLSCNTGLPLEQTFDLSEGNPVNFVVGNFEQGALDCEISEDVPAGYTASYQSSDNVGDPLVSCEYEDLSGGQYSCAITNSLEQVDVDVTKVWIDENPQFNGANIAEASWSCSNVAFPCLDGIIFNGCDSGNLNFFGNPGEDSFSVYPSWDGGTTCSVSEVEVLDSNVEIDDSECDSVVVFPGTGGSCTIYNTRLYAGIPTLSQYGLAVLALLMLGVGLVGFRRFV